MAVALLLMAGWATHHLSPALKSLEGLTVWLLGSWLGDMTCGWHPAKNRRALRVPIARVTHFNAHAPMCAGNSFWAPCYKVWLQARARVADLVILRLIVFEGSGSLCCLTKRLYSEAR